MRRGELKKQFPELPFGKIGAKLGEIWRNMTVEEKKPYEDRATLDRERYRREMMDYSNIRGGADGYVSPPPSRKQKDDTLYRDFDDDGKQVNSSHNNSNSDDNHSNVHEHDDNESNDHTSQHLHESVDALSHAAESINQHDNNDSSDSTTPIRPITPVKHQNLNESHSTTSLNKLHSITPLPILDTNYSSHKNIASPLPFIKSEINQNATTHSFDESVRQNTSQVVPGDNDVVKSENISKPSPMTSSVNALLFAAQLER